MIHIIEDINLIQNDIEKYISKLENRDQINDALEIHKMFGKIRNKVHYFNIDYAS